MNKDRVDLKEAAYTDKNEVIHWAVGDYVVPDNRLMWTACGTLDIPDNGAYYVPEDYLITCDKCIVMDVYKW